VWPQWALSHHRGLRTSTRRLPAGSTPASGVDTAPPQPARELYISPPPRHLGKDKEEANYLWEANFRGEARRALDDDEQVVANVDEQAGTESIEGALDQQEGAGVGVEGGPDRSQVRALKRLANSERQGEETHGMARVEPKTLLIMRTRTHTLLAHNFHRSGQKEEEKLAQGR